MAVGIWQLVGRKALPVAMICIQLEVAVVWGIWGQSDMIVDGFFLCVSLPSYRQDPHPSLF